MNMLDRFDKNQKIIISVSSDSKKIIEEIQRQQFINNSVDINFMPNMNGYVVEVKKKDSE